MKDKVIKTESGEKVDFLMPDEYETRVVAFIDMLGFSELVRRSRGNRNTFIRIWNVLKTLQCDTEFHYVHCHSSAGMEITEVSDSIILSTPITHGSQLLMRVHRLVASLIMMPPLKVLCRGAITVGPLIHDRSMVFGPALLEAIDLEKKAKVPRVLVSDAILRRIAEVPTIEDYVARLAPASVVDTSFEDWNRMKGALRQDNDGCYFVDYLKGGPRGGLSYSGYDLLRESILCMINNPENQNEDFWEKYEWLVQYFNTSVNELSLPGIEPIVPPELNPGK